MGLGIRNFIRKSADQTVTASVTLVDVTEFTTPIAAGQRVYIKYSIAFTVGASGGYKFQWVVPAAPTTFRNSYQVVDAATATPVFVEADTQTASAAFANALAVAGTHQLNGELDFVNGANAGTVTLQFACNSAAGAIVFGLGSSMDIIYN